MQMIKQRHLVRHFMTNQWQLLDDVAGTGYKTNHRPWFYMDMAAGHKVSLTHRCFILVPGGLFAIFREPEGEGVVP